MNNYWHIICVFVHFHSLLLCFPELKPLLSLFCCSVSSGEVIFFSQFLWKISVISNCFCWYKQYIPSIFRTLNIITILNLRFQYYFVLDQFYRNINFDIIWFFVYKKKIFGHAPWLYFCTFKICIILRYTVIYLKFQLIEIIALLCLTNLVIIWQK